jgi:hypothetical protein
MEITILLTVASLIVTIGTILNLIRVDEFSKFMRAETQRVYEARKGGKRDEPYPCVTASYNNLKWYDVLNRDYKSMVVYDNTY